MSDLKPASGIEILELASTLFTDYAEKQRLLKIPEGKQVVMDGDGLPIFPDGTLLAKTFYYSKTKNGVRQIIETRLLIFKENTWSAATYRWNEEQTDAELLTEGAVVPIDFTDQLGGHRSIQYAIPSQNDCSSCHRSNDKLTPLGPKVRNLNTVVKREGTSQNQLLYLIHKKMLKSADISQFAALPSYSDSTGTISLRTRAYFEMNCAHCHQPSGLGGKTSLNLEYTTPFNETGINYNKQNILMRMSTMGEFHMPKKGTTIVDDEGLALVKDYILSLKHE
jgi:uncharacterized repeat protein (TIGR03806 family)